MPDTDRQQILAIVRAQEAATARGDAAGVVASVAQDAVLYNLQPPLEYRAPAAHDTNGLNDWFATWENGVVVELADPTVLIDGDLAVVFGLSRMQGVKKDGGPIDIWNRRTIVLRRGDGTWQFVHEHESYPMRMDGSDKAALDLTPDGNEHLKQHEVGDPRSPVRDPLRRPRRN